MGLDSFIDKIPEADREAYKAEIANALFISDKDQAAKLLAEHPVLKSAKDSYESKAVAAYEKRFMEEKLPGLLDAEYKKKHPDADPRDLEVQQVREEMAKFKTEALLERRKAETVQKLAKDGLPVELADLLVDANDDQYKAKYDLAAAVKRWHEEETAKVKGSILGNQGTPKAGGTGTVDFSKMSDSEIMAYARKGPAEEAEVVTWRRQRK